MKKTVRKSATRAIGTAIQAAIKAAENHSPADLTMRELVAAYDAAHPAKAITYHVGGWLEAMGDANAWGIQTDDLKAGVDAMLKAGYSPGYTNRQISALGSAYKWAVDERMTPRGFHSPTRGVRRKAEAMRRVEFTPEETQRLRDAAHATRDRLFTLHVLMLMDSGARPGEILARTWGDFDLEKGEITIPTSKTDKPRVLFFTPETVQLAKRLRPKDADQLMFAGRKGRPVDFRKKWLHLFAMIGRPSLRPYDLRHMAAARLLRSGETLAVTAQVLGHSSLILHRRYGHLETGALRAAQEQSWSVN